MFGLCATCPVDVHSTFGSVRLIELYTSARCTFFFRFIRYTFGTCSVHVRSREGKFPNSPPYWPSHLRIIFVLSCTYPLDQSGDMWQGKTFMHRECSPGNVVQLSMVGQSIALNSTVDYDLVVPMNSKHTEWYISISSARFQIRPQFKDPNVFRNLWKIAWPS